MSLSVTQAVLIDVVFCLVWQALGVAGPKDDV